MSGYLPQTVCTPEQYHCNYGQIDHATAQLLNSDEARKVTGQMTGIYVMLKIAPWDYWEAPNRLRIIGDQARTAWEILCELANTSSATLRKAIKWMAEKGVIKYWSWKNGIGLRIYFNLAINSVRRRESQKNLRLVPTSTSEARTSAPEVALYEENHVFFIEVQDSDLDASRELPTPTAENTSDVVAAPATFADDAAPVAHTKPTLQLVPPVQSPSNVALQLGAVEALAREMGQLKQALQDVVRSVPSKDWWKQAAIPMAIRVALAEVFRHEHGRKQPAALDVGGSQPVIDPHVLDEYDDLAREEAWKENALRALPPDEYAQRIAALEQAASGNSSYATLNRWTDDAKRAHFDALLKRQLWEAQR